MNQEPSAQHGDHAAAGVNSAAQDALADFESRLSARTKVPPHRLSEYLAWSDREVKEESQSVARVLKRFAEAVVRAMEDASTADEFLHELDLKAISRDHDWRAIFSTIRAQSSGYEGYKRAVLIKYLQYLSFRKRLLEFIYARKAGLDETDAFTDLSMLPEMVRKQREAADGAAPVGARDEELSQMLRLPFGEAVEVELPTGRKLDMMMAGHMFRLLGEDPPCLIDQNGVMYFLKPGRNMVGRHPESDVVIDPNFSDISRAHIIIDWRIGQALSIMDFSSRGTYLHADALTRVPAGFAA